MVGVREVASLMRLSTPILIACWSFRTNSRLPSMVYLLLAGRIGFL